MSWRLSSSARALAEPLGGPAAAAGAAALGATTDIGREPWRIGPTARRSRRRGRRRAWALRASCDWRSWRKLVAFFSIVRRPKWITAPATTMAPAKASQARVRLRLSDLRSDRSTVSVSSPVTGPDFRS